jgi:hypothetical protein
VNRLPRLLSLAVLMAIHPASRSLAAQQVSSLALPSTSEFFSRDVTPPVDRLPVTIGNLVKQLKIPSEKIALYSIDKAGLLGVLKPLPVGGTIKVALPTLEGLPMFVIERLPIDPIKGDKPLAADFRRYRGAPVNGDPFVEMRLVSKDDEIELVVIADQGIAVSSVDARKLYVVEYPLRQLDEGPFCLIRGEGKEPVVPLSMPASESENLPVRTLRVAMAPSYDYYDMICMTTEKCLWTALRHLNAVAGILRRDLQIELTPILSPGIIPGTLRWKKAGTEEERMGALQHHLDKLAKAEKIVYDIGHTMGHDRGGQGRIGTACVNGKKAYGETGFQYASPSHRIAALTHEMSHQLNAYHAYNGDCKGRDDLGAFEPGGGATLMGFFGKCEGGPEDKLPFLHAQNVGAIMAHVNDVCHVQGVVTPTNTPPTLANQHGDTYVALRDLPFELRVEASDGNGSLVRVRWEEERRATAVLSIPPPAYAGVAGDQFGVRVFEAPRSKWGGATPNGTLHFVASGRDLHGGLARYRTNVRISSVEALTYILPNQASAGTPFDVAWKPVGQTDQAYEDVMVDVGLSLDGGKTFKTLKTLTAGTGHAKLCSSDAPAAGFKAMIRVSGKGGGFIAKSAPFEFAAAGSSGASCP